VKGESRLWIGQYNLLAGEFDYPLPVELRDCLLVHGEKLYRLGTLEPGQRVRIDELTPLNLEARLTERTVLRNRDVATQWNRTSTDLSRIVPMMMFHEAARGRTYTGLTNRYQPYVDLTQHVRLGRAVLAGRAAERATRLTQGDSPLAEDNVEQTWTWYRVILPVGQQPPETSSP
jgi:hypothetical protein